MIDIFDNRLALDSNLKDFVAKKARRKLTDEDRIAILVEYFETGEPASKIADKYRLSSRAVLFGWMDRYLNEGNELRASIQDKDEQLGSEEELQQEIERLRKALALEKMRSRAYDKMIDVAEKSFNIPIRKKHGTKQ